MIAFAIWPKVFFVGLLAFIGLYAPAWPAVAAEITCLDGFKGGGPTAPWAGLDHWPSGRRPMVGTCYEFLIKGEIQVGDSTKFESLLRSSHPFSRKIKLWSSGGVVEEAMKIGRLVRAALLETEAPSGILFTTKGHGRLVTLASILDPAIAPICQGPGCHCASACFLIWAAGVDRTGDVVGVHRPSTQSTTFANLPPEKASGLYRQLITEVGRYLENMEVPRAIVERSTITASVDMYWISASQAEAMQRPPSIAEWFAASCGALGSADRRTMDVLTSKTKQSFSAQEQTFWTTYNRRFREIMTCELKKLHNAKDASSLSSR